MGVFNTLRVKMGTVLIVLIGLSILAFLLTDLLGQNSVLFGGSQNEVGEIAGETISLERYQNKVEEFKYNYQLNTGRSPSDNELSSLRQQAWDYLLVETAFQEQYEELGVTVTDQELVDMVQGNNISPIVRQNFTDPQTGEFDKQRVIQIIRNISSMPAQQQQQWYQFENSLPPARKRDKYDQLLMQTSFATTAEAQREYKKSTATVEAEYLYVPFYSISDSAVNVTDEELKAYLNEHKEQYKVEQTRTLNYVTFPIEPSGEDSLYLREEMEQLKTEFEQVEDDSAFARANSDRANAYKTYAISDLPKILASNTVIIKEGDVLGPYIENGAYILYKTSKIYDDTVYSVKASHVLIKAEDDTDEAEAAAKQEANDVLRKARAGEDFAELAKEYSDGPTATKGGDLGWFKEGMMVDEFNEAVFAKQGTGVINEVIKTQFGYHIIKVTEEKTAKTYKVATIEREILPSEDTRNKTYERAARFQYDNKTHSEFMAAAEEAGYRVRNSGKVNTSQRTIGALGNSREIVRWAFTDASMNKVSKVFELNDDYVVAVLTGKTEEGYASVDDVRAQLTREVKKKLQGEQIKEKLNGLSGTLQEMATAYGDDANVYSTSDLKLSATNLPSVGQAPKVIGALFGMENGATSKPLEANNGIVIAKLIAKTPAPEVADYNSYKTQLEQSRKNRVSFAVKNAIEEHADITDERYKFY